MLVGHRICSTATSPRPSRTASGSPTDFTYCRTWSGFVYVAFVIDCFSRAIVGWHATTVKDTAMVTTALKMALWRREHADHRVGAGLIHHSDYAEVFVKPRIRGDGLRSWELLVSFSA
jgi:transposase InsO family protein